MTTVLYAVIILAVLALGAISFVIWREREPAGKGQHATRRALQVDLPYLRDGSYHAAALAPLPPQMLPAPVRVMAGDHRGGESRLQDTTVDVSLLAAIRAEIDGIEHMHMYVDRLFSQIDVRQIFDRALAGVTP